ncbi:hypothetical protein PUN28_005621 [Cardiocondyla obscurior]|uniref:Uncharacterized protein n=1 Tax=Cardiocondyla obscurior TaxID=286306 RepID=A0AAW2GGW1_9HYME
MPALTSTCIRSKTPWHELYAIWANVRRSRAFVMPEKSCFASACPRRGRFSSPEIAESVGERHRYRAANSAFKMPRETTDGNTAACRTPSRGGRERINRVQLCETNNAACLSGVPSKRRRFPSRGYVPPQANLTYI